MHTVSANCPKNSLTVTKFSDEHHLELLEENAGAVLLLYVGGRRCSTRSGTGDTGRRPLLLEGRVDEEVGDGESAAAA
jgi:hypothetical protein